MSEKIPPVERPPTPEAITKAERRVRESWGRLKPLLSSAELRLNEGTARVFGGADAVLRRLPRPIQELLHTVPLEYVTGMALPPRAKEDDVLSVVEALYGISSTRRSKS